MPLKMSEEPDDYEGPWPSEDAMSEWVMVPKEPTAKQLVDGAYEVPDPISHRGELTARMVYRAMLDAAPQQVEPDAYIHKVRVLNGEPGETDYALSFAADSFPLGDAGLFESIDHRPLYRRPPADEVQRLRDALKPFAAIDLTTNQAVNAMDVLRARRVLEGE